MYIGQYWLPYLIKVSLFELYSEIMMNEFRYNEVLDFTRNFNEMWKMNYHSCELSFALQIN